MYSSTKEDGVSDQQILALIQSLGADAKTVLLVYLFLNYGLFLLITGLVTWGVRAFWEKGKGE